MSILKFLRDLGQNVTVSVHDIVADPLPETSFELIHTRYLLHLLPQRDAVLAKLYRALKPEGWLVCEVFHHFLAPYPEEDPVRDSVWKMMEDNGVARGWGRELPALLQRIGFTDLRAETEAHLYNGGSPVAEFFRLTWMHCATSC